jgi:hypothetical protein
LSKIGLRDHLLAAQAAAGQAVTATVGADIHSTPTLNDHDTSPAVGVASQLDPTIAGVPTSYSPDPMTPGMEPQNPDVRKGRRELSTSKRAAQNRAAQVGLKPGCTGVAANAYGCRERLDNEKNNTLINSNHKLTNMSR